MSKPTSKSESKWLFWRECNPNPNSKRVKGFGKFAKTQMNRLKRRFFKKEIKNELDK